MRVVNWHWKYDTLAESKTGKKGGDDEPYAGAESIGVRVTPFKVRQKTCHTPQPAKHRPTLREWEAS